MKKEEQIAEIYLTGLSKGAVKYEPDGNIPPDFSIGSTIGVEVRRLNEHFFAGKQPKGLEELSIPLQRSFEKVLASYDSRFNGTTYWVGITYERPLPGATKTIVKEMHRALNGFLAGTGKTPIDLKVNSKIWFAIYPSKPVSNRVFRPAVYSDYDSGGMVSHLYSQNISHCIQAKAQKVAPYVHRYQEWWLLLVDTIMAWDLETHETQQVKADVTSIGCFHKVLVIDGSGRSCLLQF